MTTTQSSPGHLEEILRKAGGNGGFVAWIGFFPEKAGEQILCRATGISSPAPSIDHSDGEIQEDNAPDR